MTVTLSKFVCVSVAQLCLTLCDPVNCSPPGSSVQGIPQARILEWVAMFSSRGSSQPRGRTRISYVPALTGRFFIASAHWEGPDHHDAYFKGMSRTYSVVQGLGLWEGEMSMVSCMLYSCQSSLGWQARGSSPAEVTAVMLWQDTKVNFWIEPL